MDKKILYVDMDGVCCCFYTGVTSLEENLPWDRENVDRICEANPRVFKTLPEIDGYKESIEELKDMYEIYFLSTPMQNVPESYMDKRIWLREKFGDWVKERLILTHRKDLNRGDYIIDDTKNSGVDKFQGEHIHFGTEEFPNWESVTKYLKDKYQS